MITDQIMSPAVFAKSPKDTVSKHYTFIPTTVLIADFAKLGWDVHRMSQQNSHTDREHTKHIVVFRNPNLPTVGGNIIELLLVNSHNRLASFKFMLGVFRSVGNNGLIVQSKLFESLNIRHIGYKFDDLETLTEAMLENMPKLTKAINKMEAKELDKDTQKEFAYKAIASRFPEYINVNDTINTRGIEEALDVKNFLKPVRKEDKGNSVWLTYNRIQGKLMNGGFKRISNKDQISRQVRPVTNIGLTIKLNQKLWRLAETYAKKNKDKKIHSS